MAGAAFFDIHAHREGAHAALLPQNSKDAIQITNSLLTDLNAIITEMFPHWIPACWSITQVHAGSAYNVMNRKRRICAGQSDVFKDYIFNLVCGRKCRPSAKASGTAYDAEVFIGHKNASCLYRFGK